MQNKLVGLTLGADPHTAGIYRAGKIATLAGINCLIIPPAASDDLKIEILKNENPKFVGISYRLSKEIAIIELRKFINKLENAGLLENQRRKIGFAALPETLLAVQNTDIFKHYPITLIGLQPSLKDKVLCVLDFLDIYSHEKRNQIIRVIINQSEPKNFKELDQIAARVMDTYSTSFEGPLPTPTTASQNSLTRRMKESPIPLIRTHFGVPGETIMPTIEGIKQLALQGVVDEISLGSSDLSQRYFGDPHAFKEHKNDGGVPYQTRDDLVALYQATRRGNFPAIKPYAHVVNLVEFIDTCLDVGMLTGAHQAIPLFWFCELDGRGPLSVQDALVEHIEAVRYLAAKNIPVEMNDPNQWASRYIHDALFVVDYALIAAVMFNAGVKEIILQCQFNKPVETGDFADLAKMSAAREMVEHIRPHRHPARVFLETRSGIEHFSVDLPTAKYQLARSTLLQMMMAPNMIHLVSYCEANYAATPEDIIESSQIIRRAIHLYSENKLDLQKYLEHPIVLSRKNHLIDEAKFVLGFILNNLPENFAGKTNQHLCRRLSDPDVLFNSLAKRIMTAPGITHPQFANPSLLTKPNRYGFIDCYRNWADVNPIHEAERLSSQNI